MKNWTKSIFKHFNSYYTTRNKDYDYVIIDDEPDKIINGLIYIIGKNPYYWKLCLKCPCGCDQIISLNLLKDVRPRWNYFVKRKRISIQPSIWRKVGCKSHFNVINGRVKWCNF